MLRSRLEADEHTGGLHILVGESELLRGFFLTPLGLDGKLTVAGLGQYALHLRALERLHTQLTAHMAAVLAGHLQRRVGSGGTHIQLKVLLVAVQTVLNGTAHLNTIINIDTVVTVQIHKNAVIGGDFHVYEVLVASLKHIFYNV